MFNGVATDVNDFRMPPEPLDEEDARLRDAVVGRAQAPLPEPWFIRDIRQRAASDEARVDDVAEAHTVAPSVTAARSETVAIAAATKPGWRLGRTVGVAALVIVAALGGGLVAQQMTTGAPPVTRIVTAPPLVSAQASEAAAAMCTRPESFERLRTAVVQQVTGPVASASLRRLAAGLSLGATGQPLKPGSEASACNGWLTLETLQGDVPLVVPVSYRVAEDGQVAQVTGLAPLLARLGQLSKPRTVPPAIAVPKPAPVVAKPRKAAVAKSFIEKVQPIAAKPVVMKIKARPPATGETHQSVGPSFSCRRPNSDAVRLLCRDRGLAEQDREVARRLDRAAARADPAELRRIDAERTLFLNRRESCGGPNCVARLYRDQLDDLPDDPR